MRARLHGDLLLIKLSNALLFNILYDPPYCFLTDICYGIFRVWIRDTCKNVI